MKYLFEISHPKHYYQFKFVIKILSSKHEIKIIARRKDIVCKLLDTEKVKYSVYGGHGKKMLFKFFILPQILISYLKEVIKFNPDLIISKSSPYAAIVGKLTNTNTCIMPDSEVVTFNNKFVVPFSNLIITPKTYYLDYGEKHKRVSGFFENGYLHPRVLDKDIYYNKINISQIKDSRYAILRFVGWYANHDVGKFGFSDEEKIKLVYLLKKYCRIYISSEKPLPSAIQEYKFHIPVNMMHATLFNAALYIGDSQTMATEAALCGTPAIRYNSFVGENDMSNFNILEQKKMLQNLSNFEDVLTIAKKYLEDEKSKEKAKENRVKYFQNVSDINQEIVDIIENI